MSFYFLADTGSWNVSLILASDIFPFQVPQPKFCIFSYSFRAYYMSGQSRSHLFGHPIIL